MEEGTKFTVVTLAIVLFAVLIYFASIPLSAWHWNIRNIECNYLMEELSTNEDFMKVVGITEGSSELITRLQSCKVWITDNDLAWYPSVYGGWIAFIIVLVILWMLAIAHI